MIVVSNTSPLSNLAKVGQFTLMPQLYGRILIPCDYSSAIRTLDRYSIRTKSKVSL